MYFIICSFIYNFVLFSLYIYLLIPFFLADPQWITKTFATIISLKFDFVKNGVLSCAFLQQLWRPPNYPLELHERLISLLEKFEVISRIKHGGDPAILIPCLLPEIIPSSPEIQSVWPLTHQSQEVVPPPETFTPTAITL